MIGQVDRTGGRAFGGSDVKAGALQVKGFRRLIEFALCGHRCARANQRIQGRIAEVNPGRFNVDIKWRKPIGGLLNVDLAVDGCDLIRFITQAAPIDRCINLRGGKAALRTAFRGNSSGEIDASYDTDRLEVADIDIID